MRTLYAFEQHHKKYHAVGRVTSVHSQQTLDAAYKIKVLSCGL